MPGILFCRAVISSSNLMLSPASVSTVTCSRTSSSVTALDCGNKMCGEGVMCGDEW